MPEYSVDTFIGTLPVLRDTEFLSDASFPPELRNTGIESLSFEHCPSAPHPRGSGIPEDSSRFGPSLCSGVPGYSSSFSVRVFRSIGGRTIRPGREYSGTPEQSAATPPEYRGTRPKTQETLAVSSGIPEDRVPDRSDRAGANKNHDCCPPPRFAREAARRPVEPFSGPRVGLRSSGWAQRALRRFAYARNPGNSDVRAREQRGLYRYSGG